MLIYSHITPEILIASFRNKGQVKNSSYCGIIDDNLPDDPTILTGDDLIIKEGNNTINVDIAVAITFNSIRDCKSAQYFGKLLILNGPNLDTRSIIYYKTRILNGPFAKCVLKYVQSNFEVLRAGYTGDNIPDIRNFTPQIRDNLIRESYIPKLGTDEFYDPDFVAMLNKTKNDCTRAPCDYFSHGGTYGFLGNGANPNSSTTPSLLNQVGPNIEDNETFNKMPAVFQKMSTSLSMLAANSVKKFADAFIPPRLQEANKQILNTGQPNPQLTAAPATPTVSNNIFNFFKTAIDVFLSYSLASSQIQSNIANNLGDCYRLHDYRTRYNPFSYLSQGGMNGETAADPGISGMPTSYVPKNNGILNAVAGGIPPAPPAAPAPVPTGATGITDRTSGVLRLGNTTTSTNTGLTDRSSGVLRLGNTTQAPTRTGLTDRSSGVLRLGALQPAGGGGSGAAAPSRPRQMGPESL